MRLTPDIIAVLACPLCGGSLTVDPRETAADGHVMEGDLTCACGRRYAIRLGVPRLSPDAQEEAVEQTVHAFGYQWHRVDKALKDSRFNAPEVFLDFIRPVQSEWFRGKVVLDGGCGTGRFTLCSAAFGAALTVGLDLSSAVDVAFANTRHLPNVVIVQGDLLRLPVAPVVDYAFSVGVLHHTSDPRGAFLQLASTVVPGGSMSAWVYAREHNGWIIHGLNPIRRVTSRLPRRLLLAASYALAVPLLLVVKAIYGPVSRTPALAWLRHGLFYFEYLAFLSQFNYPTLAYIVFDHAVPVIAEYIRRDDFAEWFRAAGLERAVITMRGGNSWRGFGEIVNPRSQVPDPTP